VSTAQRDSGPSPQAPAGRVPALTIVPSRTLRRCGGVTCPPGACNHTDEQPLRRHLDPRAGGHGHDTAPPIVHEVLRSSGQPLDAAARAGFEPRFGHSFADVRVHADARAAESARAVQAHAYTVGRDVVLGAAARSPGDAGTRVLAHELAHVVQQAGGPTGHTGGALWIGDPEDAAEHEADTAAAVLAPA
jgi:hypothetical protein